MKKISLMLACFGIISAAAFANTHFPQNGNKVQKTEKAQPAVAPSATPSATAVPITPTPTVTPAPAAKTEKTASPQKAESTSRTETAKPAVASADKKSDESKAERRAQLNAVKSHPGLVKKNMPAAKATPAPGENDGKTK